LLLSPNSNPPSPISLAALLDRHRSDDNLLTTLFSERAAGNVIEARKDGQQILFSFFSHGPQRSAWCRKNELTIQSSMSQARPRF
jgi:hypothetical protein